MSRTNKDTNSSSYRRKTAKRARTNSAVNSYRSNNQSEHASSRLNGVEQYAQLRKKDRRKKRRNSILIVFLVILLSGVAYGAYYLKNISDQLGMGIDDTLRASLTQTEAGEPFYMLLLGTDASKDRRNSAEFGESNANYRTDSIILARIDPKTPAVTLVSIHRDTLVNLGSHGNQKINAAYSYGGAAYTTQVVSEFAGVPISHYAEVDFEGFMNIIDDIGGIDVYLPQELNDHQGVRFDKGGHWLDGNAALLICRSRHAYDEYGDGDSFRAANQRMIISAIIKKILTLDPISMANTVSKCTKYVTTDLDVTTILSLANQMKDLDTSKNMYSGIDPTISKYVNNTWYEVCDTQAWQKMMDRVNQGLPPYEKKADDPTHGIAGSVNGQKGTQENDTDVAFTGSVTALNSTGTQGLAAKMASKLKEKGFDAIADNANTEKLSTTRIIYNGKNREVANGVKETLGAGEVIENDGSYPQNTNVVVILGTDLA